MLERRGFLRGLAALPLIGGGVRLIGEPTAPAVPISTDLMERYVAFLAHEHLAALIERFPQYRRRDLPMLWFPDDVLAESLCSQVAPSTRAAVVMSAVGLPIFGAKL